MEPAPAPHHRFVIEKLQQVAEGKVMRLALFLPPGHAKSTYASILFPAWYLGNNSDRRIIAASHTGDLADYFGRRARTIVSSAEYGAVFGFGVDDRTKAAAQWSTAQGGEYFAIGVGGGVTGRRADLGIIDDPIKGREDADSEVVRNKTWEWYKSDFRTRLKPKSAIILIQTRWHEDDLAGRIFGEDHLFESGWVEAGDGEEWFVVNLPAIAEKNDLLGRPVGEPLWPDYYTREILEQERLSQGPRNWNALYQQRPSPEQGHFFKKEWFSYFDTLPAAEHLHFYGASDYAVTRHGGDYTVHLVAAVDGESNVYIVDLWRGQTETDDWIERFLWLVSYYQPMEWAEEAGQINKSLGPFVRKRMKETGIYCYRNQYASTRDKVSRARAIQARLSMGKVFFPRRASWLADFEAELLTFPSGRHDDQVDALSLIGRIMARMQDGVLPKPEDEGKTLDKVTLDDLWAHTDRNRPKRKRV